MILDDLEDEFLVASMLRRRDMQPRMKKQKNEAVHEKKNGKL